MAGGCGGDAARGDLSDHPGRSARAGRPADRGPGICAGADGKPDLWTSDQEALGRHEAGGSFHSRNARSPAFFSQLASAIERAPARLGGAPALQWLQWLHANAPKMAVKAEEIEWTGI